MSSALLMASVAGPLPGVAVVVLKDVLYLFFRARSFFGPLGDLIAVATFVGVAGGVPSPAAALGRVVYCIPVGWARGPHPGG